MFRGHHGWRWAELPAGVSRVGAEGPRGSHRIPRGRSRHAAHGARGVPGATSHISFLLEFRFSFLSLLSDVSHLWSSFSHFSRSFSHCSPVAAFQVHSPLISCVRFLSFLAFFLSLFSRSAQNYEMLWSSNEHTKGTMGNFGGIQPYWLMWCMSILDLYDATGVTSIPHPSLQATPSQHDSSDDSTGDS